VDEAKAASEQAGQAAAELARPAVAQPTTQSVEVTAAAPSLQAAPAAPAPANPDTGGSVADSSAKTAAEAASHASLEVTGQATMGAMKSSRKKTQASGGAALAVWSVSPNGIVQRSYDGARTFQPVAVAQGIKFQTVAAIGNTVWAGGTGGALFHSADAGVTWTQVAIRVTGITVTESLAVIQMNDPQHLIVTTASGLEYVSEDGGLHWQKQR
jgi:photosystem II stability/assembly factor-like uncharacterized protein